VPLADASKSHEINQEAQIHTQEIIVIEPAKAGKRYWRDLFRYRELFFFLAWRDVLVRYKQTVIGFAWSLLRPLLTMLVFTLVFGKFANLPSEGIPYPVFVFAALLPWQFFSNALAESSMSLVTNANMISKVYFPRLVVPTSSVVVSFIDFLIALAFLVLLMFWYQIMPGREVLLLPFFVILAFCAAMGAGLWLSALTVKYRDFRYIVPFIVQFGLFVSPVGFSSTIVPERWRLLYSLNPMVGVIDGFRWTILSGGSNIYVPGVLASLLTSTALLVSGLWYFRKTERSFADVI